MTFFIENSKQILFYNSFFFDKPRYMKSERAYISHLLIIKLATDEERRNEKRKEKARRNAGK